MTEIVNFILIVFVLVAAVAAVRVRELVSAVFLLGAFSFFLAVLWSVLAAPDVSFTEAMVGAGASTIFFLLALFGSGHYVADKPPSALRPYALLAVIGFGLFLLWGSLDLAMFGDLHSAPSENISPFYLTRSFADAATPNAVTAIVVDYRGFDTLIETTVIFTAGVACFLVLTRGKKSA